MSFYRDKAIEKLKSEKKAFKGSNKETAIKKALCDALTDFCKQDEEFAQAVAQNEKTLSDCAKEIMKDVGSSISDIEVYRRAVQFYFAGAEIHMTMRVDLCGSLTESTDKPIDTIGSSNLTLDLSDFL